MYNDVCCNDQQKDMLADWPDAEFCAQCPLFEPETPESIEKYKWGHKEYVR